MVRRVYGQRNDEERLVSKRPGTQGVPQENGANWPASGQIIRNPYVTILGGCQRNPGFLLKSGFLNSFCHLDPHMTKDPTVKSVSFSKLEDTGVRGYGATRFESALRRFIAQFQNPEFTPHQVKEMATFLALPF